MPRTPVPAGDLLRPCEGRPRFPAPARAAASRPWPSSDCSPVARPESPADPSATMGTGAAGPPRARDPATRDRSPPRPHLLRHRADGLVGGSEDSARPAASLRRRRLAKVALDWGLWAGRLQAGSGSWQEKRGRRKGPQDSGVLCMDCHEALLCMSSCHSFWNPLARTVLPRIQVIAQWRSACLYV